MYHLPMEYVHTISECLYWGSKGCVKQVCFKKQKETERRVMDQGGIGKRQVDNVEDTDVSTKMYVLNYIDIVKITTTLTLNRNKIKGKLSPSMISSKTYHSILDVMNKRLLK